MLNIFSIFLADAKTIIFDLHGVLLERSKNGSASHIGYLNYGSYCISSSTKGLSFEQRCQDFLKTLEQYEVKEAKLQNEPLPKIIGQWLKGEKKAQDLIKEINIFIEKSKDFFKSDLEERMIKSALELMLPDKLTSVVNPVKDMARLVEECKIQKDKDGKQRHTLLILSNWDKESFPLIKKKCKKLFKHFDEKNIIISGEVGYIKPEKEIYSHIIDKFKLNPEDCIFIDDQEENIEAAKKAGIKNSIHHKEYEVTRKKLMDLEILEDKSNKKSKVKSKISFKGLFE
jgi:putative hydrolase of the HAD superfamily